MLMEREYIGEGNQHIIYRSRQNPGYVLKKPRLRHLLALNVFFSTTDIKNDLENAESITRNEAIIPEARLFTFRKTYFMIFNFESYIIRQKWLEPTTSEEITPNFQNNLLRDLYENAPDNFISQEGVFNWIDPIRGNFSRLLEKTGIMSWPTYKHIMVKIRRILK